MYEFARRKMNARQDTYATYYDKKVLSDPLKVGDLVYVYLPRNKNVKLAKKWKGPHKIVFAGHPVYHVEIVKDKRTVTKVYTWDKLKRIPEAIHYQRESDSEQENEDLPEFTPPDLTQSKDDTDLSSQSDVEMEHGGQGPGGNARYNLRADPGSPTRYDKQLLFHVL